MYPNSMHDLCTYVDPQEIGIALEIGASVLLPPVHDRIDLLLSILPDDPSSIVTLTTGQVHKLYKALVAKGTPLVIFQIIECKPA